MCGPTNSKRKCSRLKMSSLPGIFKINTMKRRVKNKKVRLLLLKFQIKKTTNRKGKKVKKKKKRILQILLLLLIKRVREKN